MQSVQTGGEGDERQGYPDHRPLLIPVPEAARLLGVGLTLCWEMVHRGELPSVRLGHRVLIPRVAVERLAGLHDQS